MRILRIILVTVFILVLSQGLFSQNNKTLSENQIISIIKKMKNFNPTTGYDGSLIFKNNISFYVNEIKLNDLNKFDVLFLENNIKLNSDEILKIGKFIQFISQSSKKYKNTNINLLSVYKNLKIFLELKNKTLTENQVINIIKKMKKFNPTTGYDGSLIINNNISFFVNNSKIKDLNKFDTTFLENNIKLNSDEILKIGKFIQFISQNFKKYKNTDINLLFVYNSIKLFN